MNIDSDIIKWPILNSEISEILEIFLVDLYDKPCPACTSNPKFFASFAHFSILKYVVRVSLPLLNKLQNFPVWSSTQSTPKICEIFMSLTFGSINKLILLLNFLEIIS